MKKTFLILLSSSYLLAQDIQMPPAIPTLNFEKKELKKEVVKQDNCSTIPPMLHLLPPPLQESLDKCMNDKFMPKKELVKRYLDKNKISYKNITISQAKGFVRVYEIDLGNKTKLFCNEKVTRCLK